VTANLSAIQAAARDAGNKSMRRAGRTEWDENDWNCACALYAKLLKILNPPTR
jgi:hypothetical protein